MMRENFISTVQRSPHDIDSTIEDNKHVIIAVTGGVQDHVLGHELFPPIAPQPLNHFVSESLKRKLATEVSIDLSNVRRNVRLPILDLSERIVGSRHTIVDLNQHAFWANA